MTYSRQHAYFKLYIRNKSSGIQLSHTLNQEIVTFHRSREGDRKTFWTVLLFVIMSGRTFSVERKGAQRFAFHFKVKKGHMFRV